jgi:transcriptional regulator with GAF, ATPase, and Fis domain
MSAEDQWEQMSETVRAMGQASSLDETLRSALTGALEMVKHAEHAGVSMVYQHTRIETPAATDDVARRGDELQYELGEGPCLQSIRRQETVWSDDLTVEHRWPRWSQRASDELGVRSMLCLQLFVTHDTLGALNLYSSKPRAFESEDRTAGLALAAHIAVALSSAQNVEGQKSALKGASVIGQAQGILMQRYELLPSQAFLVLARAAQRDDSTLQQISESLVGNSGHSHGSSG